MAICIAKKVLTFNIHKAKGNIGVNESSMKSTSHKRDKIFLESYLSTQNLNIPSNFFANIDT